MFIPFLIKIPIKKLQKKHEALITEGLTFFNKNKKIAYSKIEQAEKIATRIQFLKRYIVN